jgi:hypothetical protein
VPVLLAAATALGGPAPAAAGEPPFPLHPAAVLDPAVFSHAAPLRARPSAAGVSRVRLSPAVIAAARDDLADVRVVDGAARQWPFVLVPFAGHEAPALRLEPVRADPGRSRWRLVPSAAPLVIDGVTLRIDRERFDRPYRLLGDLPGRGSRVLSAGWLSRAPDQPPAIDLAVARARVDALALEVDDGDEAPLPLSEATGRAPVAELRLLAPAGEYTLLAGDPETRAPRYDIAEIRDQVLAAEAGEADVGPPAPNPLHRPHLPRGEARDRLALWVVLGVAVAALAALSLRLARKGKPPEP